MSRHGDSFLFAAAGLGMLFFAPYHSAGSASVPSPTPTAEAAVADSCPASAGLKGSVADHGAAAAQGSTLAIRADDSYFEPTCQTRVPAGEVTLEVKNTGHFLHNISFPEQGIDQDVAPGEAATVKLKMGKESLRFVCKYHSGAGMVGALAPR